MSYIALESTNLHGFASERLLKLRDPRDDTGIMEFVVLRDGTMVTRNRDSFRSWDGTSLAPIAELRDPCDWGPG